MVLAYLVANGLLYLVLGAWCTLAPDRTSQAVGFTLASPSGRSEYLTVYGGLEVGLGAFFLAAAFVPSLRTAGLVLGLATYGALALWRVGTLLTVPGVGTFPRVMLAIEVPMALLALLLWLRSA
jgi:hypothetical protein